MKTEHRGLWIALGVLVLLVLLGPLLGGGMMGPGMMWGYGTSVHGNGWVWGLGMGLGALALLAFVGALIVGGLLLARGLSDQPRAGGDRDSDDPQSILRRRYAAGEIDQATYERIKRELEGAQEWPRAEGAQGTQRADGHDDGASVGPAHDRSDAR
jgi:putative membrane protein